MRFWAAAFRIGVLAGVELKVRILGSMHRVVKLRQDVVSVVELRVAILGWIRPPWEPSLWKKRRGHLGMLVGLPHVNRSEEMIM